MVKITDLDSAPDEIVQELYLGWLLEQCHSYQLPKDLEYLLIHLHLIEFYSVDQRDVSREEDGQALRQEFERDTNFSSYDGIQGPCTVLEFLIGVAYRLDFFCTPPENQTQMHLYLLHLLKNLRLTKDPVNVPDVDYKIDRMITRTYAKNGYGGLFPIRHPDRLPIPYQTQAPIWSQMSAYICEHQLLYKEVLREYGEAKNR